MRRGEIWTAAGGKDYARKPRPVVIVQDDRFEGMDSVTVCPLTSDLAEAPLFRIPIEPNERNGLYGPCRLMVDKITTMPKTKIGQRIGWLDQADLVRVNRAMTVFLGVASEPARQRSL